MGVILLAHSWLALALVYVVKPFWTDGDLS